MTLRPAARVLVLTLSLVSVVGGFIAVVEPWFIRWGATDDEARKPLPGDEIIPRAARQGVTLLH